PSTPIPTRLPITLIAPGELPTSTFTDPVLRLGESLYFSNCAHCHGYNGEGQVGALAENTLQLGMKTVPPHNADGNLWRYADQVLVRTIQQGIINPLNQFPMPAFGETLSEDDIHALLAFIRLWWTDDQRAYQAEVTANMTARLAGLSGGLPTEEAPFPTATPE
ncbi:MAG: cytochrome c, partial [Anaerolineaceae bacterium]|nr:cytochrome c [Anaerolineaceae bacterium]